MSLYFYTQPTLLDIFDDDDFFNHQLISRNDFGFGHPCRTFRYRGHCKRPYHSMEKQLSKIINNGEIFKFEDFSPKINLSEDEKNYYIHADLPGIKKDQIKMELDENRILTISGERESFSTNDTNDMNNDINKNNNMNENEEKMETDENTTTTSNTQESKPDENKSEKSKPENETKTNDERKYSRIECSYGKFERSFTVPENGDLQSIQAKMENGVLEIMIPKNEPPKKQNRTIQIQ